MRVSICICILLFLLSIPVFADGPRPLVGDDLTNVPGVTVAGANSRFMIGKIAIAIILPESNGIATPSTEDWTVEQVEKVRDEILESFVWWATREPRAGLSFEHEFYIVPSDYEPIASDSRPWLIQAMWELGYILPGDVDLAVEKFNDDLRARYASDFAFTVFVINSYNDPDGCFPSGTFAYADSGLFVVMTWDNGGYGIEEMAQVMAHETGHIFGALDQYYSAHVPCERRGGILQIENQNSNYPGDCLLHELSIMKWGPNSYRPGLVDWYARGQLGWRDSDCDGILDPVDSVGDHRCKLIYLPLVIFEKGALP